MRTKQFYIPNVSMWNWKLVSPTFVRLQYDRAKMSYRETDNALDNLDEDVRNIEQEIKGKWASGSVQVMRAFEARLKEVRAERKRIYYVRMKLDEVITEMDRHGASLISL